MFGGLDSWSEYTAIPRFVTTCLKTGFIYPIDRAAYVPELQDRGLLAYRLDYGPGLFELFSYVEAMHLADVAAVYPACSFRLNHPQCLGMPFPDTEKHPSFWPRLPCREYEGLMYL